MGRSEMWRLKKQLVDSVVFTNKQINACKVHVAYNYFLPGYLRVSRTTKFSEIFPKILLIVKPKPTREIKYFFLYEIIEME